MSGLRSSLAAKRAVEFEYPLPIGSALDITAAQRVLVEAEQALRLASMREDEEATKSAEAEVAAAEQAVRDLHLMLTLRNMSPSEYEQLLDEHPATDEDVAAGEPAHRATFQPALLAKSVVDDEPMTADEWAAELASGRWSKAEVDDLYAACKAVNVRLRSVSVPKGSAPTRRSPKSSGTASRSGSRTRRS